MNILLLTETLHTGGAETFVVRLANALHRKGHHVFLFVVFPRLSKKEILETLQPGIEVTLFQQKSRVIKRKADSIFFRLNIDYSILQKDVTRALRRLISQRRIDVVHSHLFPTDYYVACIDRKGLPTFRHVSTHHGDYLLFRSQQPYGIKHYQEKLLKTLRSLTAMAVISDEQQLQFEGFRQQWQLRLAVHKILNGYEVPVSAPLSRQSIGIGGEDFVFGMVARGIPEKGWAVLIDAFLAASLPGTQLLLVGEGPETARLRAMHGQHPAIHFAGYTANTIGYIRLFDVGLLPSSYKAESLPTVVIEYLYCGRPVIATRLGEIERMIATPSGDPAGLLLDFDGESISAAQLAGHMKLLYENKQLRTTLAANASPAFQKFDMEYCVAQYLDLYRPA